MWFNSRLSVLFHCLALCHYHAILSTIALQYSLKSSSMIPPALFFFSQDCFGSSRPFMVSYKFQDYLFQFSRKKKICHGLHTDCTGLDMITFLTFLLDSMWIFLMALFVQVFLQVSSQFLVRIIPHTDIFLVCLLGEVSSESSHFTILIPLRNTFIFIFKIALLHYNGCTKTVYI